MYLIFSCFWFYLRLINQISLSQNFVTWHSTNLVKWIWCTDEFLLAWKVQLNFGSRKCHRDQKWCKWRKSYARDATKPEKKKEKIQKHGWIVDWRVGWMCGCVCERDRERLLLFLNFTSCFLNQVFKMKFSSLHWSFSCFLCCFSSAGVYSNYTSSYYLRHSFC